MIRRGRWFQNIWYPPTKRQLRSRRQFRFVTELEKVPPTDYPTEKEVKTAGNRTKLLKERMQILQSQPWLQFRLPIADINCGPKRIQTTTNGWVLSLPFPYLGRAKCSILSTTNGAQLPATSDIGVYRPIRAPWSQKKKGLACFRESRAGHWRKERSEGGYKTTGPSSMGESDHLSLCIGLDACFIREEGLEGWIVRK